MYHSTPRGFEYLEDRDVGCAWWSTVLPCTTWWSSGNSPTKLKPWALTQHRSTQGVWMVHALYTAKCNGTRAFMAGLPSSCFGNSSSQDVHSLLWTIKLTLHPDLQEIQGCVGWSDTWEQTAWNWSISNINVGLSPWSCRQEADQRWLLGTFGIDNDYTLPSTNNNSLEIKGASSQCTVDGQATVCHWDPRSTLCLQTDNKWRKAAIHRFVQFETLLCTKARTEAPLAAKAPGLALWVDLGK